MTLEAKLQRMRDGLKDGSINPPPTPRSRSVDQRPFADNMYDALYGGQLVELKDILAQLQTNYRPDKTSVIPRELLTVAIALKDATQAAHALMRRVRPDYYPRDSK
jgi:hypothetical protein